MIRRRATALAVLGLLTAALAIAADGFVLLRVAKENDEHRYKQEVTLSADGEEIVFVSQLTEKITKVEGDTITSELSTKLTGLKAQGEEIELPDEEDLVETSVYVAKNTGTIVKIEEKSSSDEDDSEESLKEQYRLGNMSAVIVDATPRKVGDQWKVETKASENGVRASTATYEIVGEETVAGKDSLKLKVEAKETEGSDPIEVTGFIWIAKTGGLVTKSEVDVKNLPLMGETMDAKIVTELVP